MWNLLRALLLLLPLVCLSPVSAQEGVSRKKQERIQEKKDEDKKKAKVRKEKEDRRRHLSNQDKATRKRIKKNQKRSVKHGSGAPKQPFFQRILRPKH